MMDERLDQMPADARDDALAYGREREQERLECWRAQIGDSDAVMYLRTRGVSLDTARKWGLGYDRERKRLVIPYVGSEYFHVDRDITGGAEEKYTVPSTDELGSLPLYNPSAFDSPAFYVVEGPLDALAILDEGKPAVALCGTNYEEVVAASVSRGYRGTIIAALDSDAEGRKAQERFMLALKQSGLYGVEFSYHRGAKDAAEARCIEPVQFSVDIARAYEKAVQTRREKLLGSYHEALRHLRVQGPGDVLRGICFNEDSVHPVPTGFRQLDHWLGGGLMPGLYLVGSAATVGKTSLCLQIADQIAEAGHPVMFVSVVQRANELIAKSIARYLYRERPERGAQSLSPTRFSTASAVRIGTGRSRAASSRSPAGTCRTSRRTCVLPRARAGRAWPTSEAPRSSCPRSTAAPCPSSSSIACSLSRTIPTRSAALCSSRARSACASSHATCEPQCSPSHR